MAFSSYPVVLSLTPWSPIYMMFIHTLVISYVPKRDIWPVVEEGYYKLVSKWAILWQEGWGNLGGAIDWNNPVMLVGRCKIGKMVLLVCLLR